MYRVCVMMSTYNGENYLIEQIESILEQEGVEVSLFVRDDGSKDSTVDILSAYQKEGKVHLYIDNCNLGPAISFMKLLYESTDYDYYAFADQDDVWHKEKLLVAISMIEKYKDIPSLYCSNQWLFREGKVERLRFEQNLNHGIVQAICGNVFSGCTMVFNWKLASILKQKENHPSEAVLKSRMHDTWVIAVAECVGKVIYDNNSYINYRIHSNNTVGIKSGRLQRLRKKITNKSLRNGRSRLAQDLMRFSISDKEKSGIVQAFALNDVRLLLRKSIVRASNDRYFVIKTLLGMN